MSEPTSALCVVCPVLRPPCPEDCRRHPNACPNREPLLPRRAPVCDWCRDRLATDLSALPGLYGMVDTQPVRGTTQVLSRVFESKPPLNLSALSLLGPGSDTPAARLVWWCMDWATHLDQAPPTDMGVSGSAGWLSARLEWACDHHPTIGQFAGELREVVRQLRPYAGSDDGGYPAGKCPRRLKDGTLCGADLYAPVYASKLQCPRCKQDWHRDSGGWLKLRAAQLRAQGLNPGEGKGEAA